MSLNELLPTILDEGQVVEHGGEGQGHARDEVAGDAEALSDVRAQLHTGVDADGEKCVDLKCCMNKMGIWRKQAEVKGHN